ncbi:WXG100 family type VII secretion target [Mangrovihabitans endophyticus]|uniref:ESAT-6-like protein n=1 Tax=Mangrovihabitans endophyticus TaxID=1751298 RepID=A0A8J3BY19_9ACTN|nr:WXG100 family type VII secretion target [Mangrovihabitans endophyticus]GGK78780.1 hypothetical protein GCM10012284_10860 [Mangrovihabitans endophyticus]
MWPIAVTPEELYGAAQHTNATASDIEMDLAHLKRYVIEIQQKWHGVSATRFHHLMDDFDRCGRHLHHALTEIAVGLRHNAHNYVDTERTVDANLGQVQNEIPAARL